MCSQMVMFFLFDDGQCKFLQLCGNLYAKSKFYLKVCIFWNCLIVFKWVHHKTKWKQNEFHGIFTKAVNPLCSFSINVNSENSKH